MLKRKHKLVLAFKDDVVISLEPMTLEEEKIADKLFGEMIESKWRAWCG